MRTAAGRTCARPYDVLRSLQPATSRIDIDVRLGGDSPPAIGGFILDEPPDDHRSYHAEGPAAGTIDPPDLGLDERRYRPVVGVRFDQPVVVENDHDETPGYA